MSQAISERELNIIRGKVMAGHATQRELFQVFDIMDRMEQLLEDGDQLDAFGTEGWRHHLGWDD